MKRHLLKSRYYFYQKGSDYNGLQEKWKEKRRMQRKRREKIMWLLVLLLSIKLNMPTWYWILFTIITIIKPLFIEPVKFEIYQEFWKQRKNK